MSVVNAAAYHFASLDQLPERRKALSALCHQLALKGTILLSREGINLFVAGERAAIDRLFAHLRADPALAELNHKESESDEQPFSRMLVKIKREIISFGVADIDPVGAPAPRVSARQLKSWLDAGEPVVLLDTRNDYEVALGTFDNAVTLPISRFRDFPQAVAKLPRSLRQRRIVSFCTGGIRCEKAAPMLIKAGFSDVYQLDGGILKYFEECGGDHYLGDCYVFDKRVALDSTLHETEAVACYVCQSVVTKSEQHDPRFVPGVSCPACFRTREQRARDRRELRQAQIAAVADPLPGASPYTNRRPVNVPEAYDGASLVEFLAKFLPHAQGGCWQVAVERGELSRRGVVLRSDATVRAGDQLLHTIPNTVDPPVNAAIVVLYEDEAMFVVAKPAPLPVHPCGRFNRNTLTYILNKAIPERKLRPVHRLDANTTGVQVFAKTKEDARHLQQQFERREVTKRYLIEVCGVPSWTERDCRTLITADAGASGTRQAAVAKDSDRPTRSARAIFRVLGADRDHALLSANALSGRTNQLRVQLSDLGFPIRGDRAYDGTLDPEQALTITDGGVLHLHAAELRLRHPRASTEIAFSAPEPAWLEALRRRLDVVG